jgi:aspartyl/asparaginyl beta-hydroxylase (cupin superfamily)
MSRVKALFFLTEEDLYDGPEPFFYPHEPHGWVQQLESNWRVIANEMAGIIEGLESIELSSSNPPYLSNPKAWKNVYFYNFMWKYHANCKRYPATYALLKSIPNLTFAEFTVLEPHSRVLPHIGETNTTIRGHLGIRIPGTLPLAGIRVGDEERSWEEGKAVLFSDCHRHTVWNDTDGRRFVLVFDVMRPEFADRKLWMCAQSLSSLTIKWSDSRIPFFKRMPTPLLSAVHKMVSVIWYVYVPLQNRISWLP